MPVKKKLGSGRHLSAYKRQRQNEKRRQRNRSARSALRTEIKKCKAEPSSETFKNTQSSIAKIASKGILPKRRASRMISRLARQADATA